MLKLGRYCPRKTVTSHLKPSLLILIDFLFVILQGKFSVSPSVFVTAKHDNPGLKRDACALWIEDVTTSNCKVCLRELQNYAGAHEDIYVVSLTHELHDDQILNALEITRAKVATYKFIAGKSNLSSRPSCSGAGQRHLPDKSLSSGYIGEKPIAQHFCIKNTIKIVVVVVIVVVSGGQRYPPFKQLGPERQGLRKIFSYPQ